MTAAKLDHTALSLEAIDDAQHVHGTVSGAHFLAIAQVHATLAVAEQARLANLIAYRVAYGDYGSTWLSDANSAAADESFERLGLK